MSETRSSDSAQFFIGEALATAERATRLAQGYVALWCRGVSAIARSLGVDADSADSAEDLVKTSVPVVTPITEAPSARQPAPQPVSSTTPPVSELPIPEYDSLAASQVVARLRNLDRDELVSVQVYETANRGRRTILSMIEQRLSE